MYPSSHPLQRWPHSNRAVWLVAALVAAVLPLVASPIFTPLNEGEPGGASIVDFEFAGSVERAEEIIGIWEAEDVVGTAKAIQLFDLIYPLVYAAAFAGLALAVGRLWAAAGRPRLAEFAPAAAWAVTAAAGFDYIENLGLAVSLWGDPAAPWPQIAYVAAVIKFAGIYLALAYALSGALPLFQRLRHSRQTA
ncbi:MAG: hypothetical protein ACR2K6_10755 [Solirubrobacterales bacterium]